jgi:uncharacterized protein YktA (UPF0223 family)
VVVFTAAPFSIEDSMSKKTYRTFSLKNLQICFKNEEGRRIEIIFRGGIQIDSTAKFVTDDEYLQKRLESSSGFGRDYYLESEVDTNPVQAPAPEKKVEKAPAPEKEIVSGMKDSRRFKNLVEMKNAMKEAGIAFDENATYAQAKAVAAAAGYDYQIKK